MTEKKYTYEKECKNCGEINELKIPLGQSVDSFLEINENIKCKKCGLNLIQKEIGEDIFDKNAAQKQETYYQGQSFPQKKEIFIERPVAKEKKLENNYKEDDYEKEKIKPIKEKKSSNKKNVSNFVIIGLLGIIFITVIIFGTIIASNSSDKEISGNSSIINNNIQQPEIPLINNFYPNNTIEVHVDVSEEMIKFMQSMIENITYQNTTTYTNTTETNISA